MNLIERLRNKFLLAGFFGETYFGLRPFRVEKVTTEAPIGHIFVGSVLGLKGVPAVRAASSVIGTASSAISCH